jgi:hypothetical protein
LFGSEIPDRKETRKGSQRQASIRIYTFGRNPLREKLTREHFKNYRRSLATIHNIMRFTTGTLR